jgi:hypothetical protein
LELSLLFFIFAPNKEANVMKESKPYPLFEDEDGSCLTAQEPAVGTAYTEHNLHAEPHHIPGLPESWDELLDCLKEGEEEIERGEGTSWDEVINEIRLCRNSHVA